MKSGLLILIIGIAILALSIIIENILIFIVGLIFSIFAVYDIIHLDIKKDDKNNNKK